jgi:exodeoxyribonuclease VII small subunit
MGDKMKEISFEKALEKLEVIVSELEEGELALDASLKKYEEGITMVRICQEKLEKARKKIDLLMKDENGKFTLKTFEEKE